MSNDVPTLSDVAARAGVGKAAVSAALNGSRVGTRVSEATRQRILDAAKELNYHPNVVARSLRSRTTNVIGFYNGFGASDTHKPFYAEIISGLERGCEAHSKDLLIQGTARRGRTEDEMYAGLVNGQVHGLLIFARSGDPLVPRLSASPLAVIGLANPVPFISQVVVDDAHGSRLLAELLASRGHRRVLYRKCPDKTLSLAQRRFTAFQEAASQLGLLIIEGEGGAFHGRLSDQEKAILDLPLNQRPTAAVGWFDDAALGLLSYCQEHGIRVPDDLAVVGFDGLWPAMPPFGRLTTIRAPWSQVAQTAVSHLMTLLAGKEVPQETVIPVELVVGDTT